MEKEKLIKYLIKYWHYLILITAAIIFFIGSGSYCYFTQKNNFIKWQSPDETANYIFAKLYAQEGRLELFEKYNIIASDIIHPRSFRSDFGWLKPVSFLGISLIYGKIACFTSYKILPYLTPLFAAAGIIFYYLLIKNIFGKRNALMSSLMLFSFPVYIYYSARCMFHNVIFIFFLIGGLYFGVLMARKKLKKKPVADNGQVIRNNKINISGLVYAALSGLFIGSAIISRSSELLWLIPLLIILWLFNLKKIGFIKLLVFLEFIFLALLPVFYYNQILYGSFWRGGYGEMNQSILNITSAGTALIENTFTGQFAYLQNILITLKNNIFYFGWHPDNSTKMLFHYFTVMFYWIFWPAVLGFIWFASKIKKWKIKHWSYVTSYLIVSTILILYYGSWGFHDNPDRTSFTIGNSYTRYWLPIYLGVFPFFSYLLIKLSNIFKKKILIYSFRAGMIILIMYLGLNFLLYGSQEGLVTSAQKQINSRQELNKVLNLTENNAVIITEYHDKLFFPERKVIVGLFNDKNMNIKYEKLSRLIPVYYYNFTFPKKDLDFLNNKRLAEAGLKINEVAKVTKDFTLYKLESTKFKMSNINPQ